jgi:hypothetical protein
MSQRVASPDLQADTAADGAFGVDVTVGNTITIRAANRQRVAVFLTNSSDTDMYIGLGKDPVTTAGAEQGIFLGKLGGALVIDNWTGDIRAKHAGAATKRITGSDV